MFIFSIGAINDRFLIYQGARIISAFFFNKHSCLFIWQVSMNFFMYNEKKISFTLKPGEVPL